MQKIPTLFSDIEEVMLDLDVYGKMIQSPQPTLSELKDRLFEDFKYSKPLPTLTSKRYELSKLVSDDYKILYLKELELQENEREVNLRANNSKTDNKFDFNFDNLDKLSTSVKELFSYNNNVTDDIREELLSKYDLLTGEEYKRGIAETEKLFDTVELNKDMELSDEKIESMNIRDENEDMNEIGVSNDYEEEYTDITDNGEKSEEEYEDITSETEDDNSEDTYSDSEEDYEDEYVDITEQDDSEEYIDITDQDETDEYEEDYTGNDDYEEEYIDITSDESDEDSYSDDIDDYEEDYTDIIDNQDDEFEEDYVDIIDNQDDEFEEDYVDITEDSSYEDEVEEEYGQEDEYEEEYIDITDDSISSNIDTKNKESPITGVHDTIQISEDLSDVDLGFEDYNKPVSVPQTPYELNKANHIDKESGVVDKSLEPTDLRQFLRKHPRSTMDFVLKYFTKKQVNDALRIGKIIKKGNILKLP